MATSKSREIFTTKIEDLRKQLVGDLNMQDLQQLQLHIDLLERAAEVANDDHSHDTSEHHDHEHSAPVDVKRTSPIRTNSPG